MSCDHTGPYEIETRVFGSSTRAGDRIRVYRCGHCGAQMAMDTLPQHLLKRIFGVPVRGDTVSNLVPVDMCVIVGGAIAPLMCRIFFWSLRQVLANVGGVNFHLINLDLSAEDFGRIIELAPLCKTYTRPPVPESLWRRYRFATGSFMGVDTEWSCDWTVENCGVEKFVIISHFDLFLMRDVVTHVRSKVTDNTAMMGQHCPFFILNREAYRSSRLKFSGMGPFRLVPRSDHPDQGYLYHPLDPRAERSTMQTGLENGELLELELRFLGWEADAMADRLGDYMYHFSGGGRVLDGSELFSLKRRAEAFIREYQIP